MKTRMAVILCLCACQTYDFDPVTPMAIAQTVKEIEVNASPLKPNLFLVVDKSGSMRDPVDPACSGTCVTKIAALQGAMDTFLTQSGSAVHLGMFAFPTDATCGPGDITRAVQLDVGNDDDTRLARAALLVKTQIDLLEPSGGTPTGATLHQLSTYSPLQARDRSNYAVLMTDGEPNCNPANDANTCTCTTPGATPCASGSSNLCLDDTGTASEIALLKDKGIKTIVIGFGADVSGASGASGLATLAAAGGFSRPCQSASDCDPGDSCNAGGVDLCGRAASVCGHSFFQAANGTDLGKALDAIRAATTCPPCFQSLNARPANPSLISVLVNGAAVKSGPDSWTYHDDPATPSIEFTGSLCTELEHSTPAAPVQLEVRVVEPL
jgi:hypothetical protein